MPALSSKRIILGTAGHIDHGKTTLIKALTGVNTDRLKEEQRRGITIELGFASLDLPDGRRIGIVDVPGHERFVKNMVAGATGIDVVAMVIAADEGVMPQTREHLEICTLLDVRHGVVVLTKTDLVDEEWLELVSEDVSEFVRGTFLENQPVVRVSSVTGEGIDAFLAAVERLTREIPEKKSSGLFRLPVDRVFTMKGFGTVITGTLISGRVCLGETLMIYPREIQTKVRGVQVHNKSVEMAESGMRTAVNFQGLEKAVIQRGDIVSHPGALKSGFMADVSLHYLKSNKKPLKNRTRVRFHTGTSEILGNVILLDADEIQPGNAALAQMRLDEPTALVREDRFVIRSYSPIMTIGGGWIIDPIPNKHKRYRKNVIQGLESLMMPETEPMILYHAEQAGYRGISHSELRIVTNQTEKGLQGPLGKLLSRKLLIQSDKEKQIFVHQDVFDALKAEIAAHLSAYHADNPLKSGMPKEELKSKFPPVLEAKLFNHAISQLAATNELIQEGDVVRLTAHSVLLKGDQAALRERMLDVYRKAGLTPPYFKDVCQDLDVSGNIGQDVLKVLIGEGMIVKIKEDLFFHKPAVDDLKDRLVAFLKANGEITTPQFKEITNVSRKYFIPLIEYFDARNVTIRIGDIRKLRGG